MLGQYLDLEQYFPVQIQKTVIIDYYEMYLQLAKSLLNNL